MIAQNSDFQSVNSISSHPYSQKVFWNKFRKIRAFINVNLILGRDRMKMSSENKNVSPAKFLVESVAGEFFRGVKLIHEIEDSIYQQKTNSTGSIGGHFRHNLDFLNSFLNGLTIGKIDYQKRERDERIEENRNYAIERIIFSTQRLLSLKESDLAREILVCSEIDENIWHKSSVTREIEFLHSHTIHHHALIAEKLTSFGIKTSCVFGVAPSTLKFWAERESISRKTA